MSTDRPQVPDGFEKASPSGPNDDGDVPTINGDGPIEPGTVIRGLVLDITEGESDSGDWYRLRIKDDSRGVIDYFAKGDAKIAARNDRIEMGEELWIAKDTEEDSFRNSDGNKVTYHPTNVAFPSGGA